MIEQIINSQKTLLEQIQQKQITLRQQNLSHLNQYEFQNRQNHIHRSAPQIQNLIFENFDQSNQNEFIFNSCNNGEDFGYFCHQQDAQISYFQQENQHPYKDGDIFDRIQDLNFNNFDHSIVLNNELQANSNQQLSLDNMFQFNLNFQSRKDKTSKLRDFYTDRIFNPHNERDKKNRSLQKDKKQKNINNTCNNNYEFDSFDNFLAENDKKHLNFKRKQNAQNKKKYLPFRCYAKKSNILTQILPSNNVDEYSLNQKSIISSINGSQRSIFVDKCLNVSNNYQDKYKLLKKIDKLINSKSNTKNRTLFSKKCIVNEKQNYQTSRDKQIIQNSFTFQSQHDKKKKGLQNVKMFKRSSLKMEKNNNKNNEIKSKDCNRKNNLNQQIQLTKNPLNQVKNSTIKHFAYKDLSSHLLIKLSHNLNSCTYQSFILLNRLYNSSISQKSKLMDSSTNHINFLKPRINQKSKSLIEIESILVKKIETLDKQGDKLIEQKNQWQKKCKQLNRALLMQTSIQKISSQKIQNREYKNKISNIQVKNNKLNRQNELIEIIDKKRKQIKNNFDLWKQMGGNW